VGFRVGTPGNRWEEPVEAMAPSEHQRLLDLEEAISEASYAASSVASGQHKPGAAHASRPPARPSSARSARPSTASSEGCRARRPLSARSRPPSSAGSTASGHSMTSAESARSLNAHIVSGGQEFETLCDLIGSKAAQRFRSVQQCFRRIDQDHDAAVTRAEMREFCRTLNVTAEQADRFFDLLDLDRNNLVDFFEVASILGPYIQPGYQASSYRHSSAARRAEPALQENCGDMDASHLIEAVGHKASQKYRTVKDCFRFLDEDKSGMVTGEKCRRFAESLGFRSSAGDHIYSLLGDSRREVDFLMFADMFGPYIQPGYKLCASKRSSRGSSWRSSTPPPARVVEQQTPVARQRPQSARLHGRGGSRSRAAAEVRAAAEWQQKMLHSGSSAGSLASGSTVSEVRYCCSEPSEERHAAGVVDCDKPPCRAEVTPRHIGSYMYLPATPRAVPNLTWDSTQVKSRMGVYPARRDPRPPSAPRPHQAVRRTQRPRPREVEVYEDSGSHHEMGATTTTHHRDHSSRVIKTEHLSSSCTGPLVRSLQEGWSVL